MNKKTYLIFVALLVVILLVTISSNFKQSTTVARYRSELNSSDSSARVAKWNITSLTKKKGQSISLDAGFNENIEDGTGNWFFDIENSSEVTAHIKDGGTITLRLDSDSLATYGDQINWSFIDNVDNPVQFQIYVYQTSAESLLFYQKDDIELSFDAYSQLSDTDKKGYIEVVKDEAVTKLELFNTINSKLTFERKSEIIDSKIQYYYQLQINLTEQLASEIYKLGFNGTNSSLCFRVAWSVSGVGSGSSTTTEETSYFAHKIMEGTSTNTDDINFRVNGKSYYIEKRKLPFFDYLKYTSSLGGEPRFEFPTTGGTKLVSYSHLTSSQKETIKGYEALKKTAGTGGNTADSLDDLNKYTEYLEYNEYERFNQDNNTFIQGLSYLGMGLKMSIRFDLTIEQVD